MRYVLLMIVMAVVFFTSCNKTNSSNANVLLYNATWSVNSISAAWNGTSIVTAAIAQGMSSGTRAVAYLQVPAGTNLVTLKAGSDTLVDKNIYTLSSAGTSFLFFDTSAVIAARPRILQLTDILTQPDTGQISYRFIHASPDTGTRVDVWLVNGITDSVRLDTAGLFIGKEAAASAVQSFTAISYNVKAYTVKIKKTGTQILYASVANYPFVKRGIYSIIFSGLPAGTGNAGFKLSVLQHQSP
ncbi:MAG: DUF4397 domain-containing protein [Chitinophagaceae bacterium]